MNCSAFESQPKARCSVCQERDKDFWEAARRWLAGHGEPAPKARGRAGQIELATLLRGTLTEELKLLGGRT